MKNIHKLLFSVTADRWDSNDVCVQVLRLLEDVGLPELVIHLASVAVTEAVNDVNSQVALSTQNILHATAFISVRRNAAVHTWMIMCCYLQAALWTRIFKHHLDLGHNSEAYEALTQNPDSSM